MEGVTLKYTTCIKGQKWKLKVTVTGYQYVLMKKDNVVQATVWHKRLQLGATAMALVRSSHQVITCKLVKPALNAHAFYEAAFWHKQMCILYTYIKITKYICN